MITHRQAQEISPTRPFSRIIHIDSYGRRRAVVVSQNAEAMVARFGRPNCGVLTLTFHYPNVPRPIANGNSLQAFRNVLRTYLKRRFRAGLFVIETTEQGLVHVHVLIAGDRNIAQGFDWTAYDQMKMIRERARGEGRARLTPQEVMLLLRLGRSLTTNSYLREIWAELRDLAEDGRIGRAELTPIRASSPQLIRYLVKSLADGCRVGGLEQKKRRYGGWGFEWVSKVSDRPRGAQSEQYRQNMKEICVILGVEFDEAIYKPAMRAMFGPRWGWHSLRASACINRYRQYHLHRVPPPELMRAIIQHYLVEQRSEFLDLSNAP